MKFQLIAFVFHNILGKVIFFLSVALTGQWIAMHVKRFKISFHATFERPEIVLETSCQGTMTFPRLPRNEGVTIEADNSYWSYLNVKSVYKDT